MPDSVGRAILTHLDQHTYHPILRSVDFEDDALAVGQQEQEVHAESQHGLQAAPAGCLVVPVQPDFWQERRETLQEPLVQGRLGGVTAREL